MNKRRIKPVVKKIALLILFIAFIALELRLAYIIRTDPKAYVAYKDSIMEHKQTNHSKTSPSKQTSLTKGIIMNDKIKGIPYLKAEERKAIAIQTRVNQGTYKKLLSHCRKKNVTVSDFIRTNIESTLEQKQCIAWTLQSWLLGQSTFNINAALYDCECQAVESYRHNLKAD